MRRTPPSRKGIFGSTFWNMVDILNSKIVHFNTKTELANFLGIHKANIRKMLVRAEEEGLIRPHMFISFPNRNPTKKKRKKITRICMR